MISQPACNLSLQKARPADKQREGELWRQVERHRELNGFEPFSEILQGRLFSLKHLNTPQP